VKRGAVATDAGADDEQVVVEKCGSGSVVGQSGGHCGGVPPAPVAVVVLGTGSECLAAETTEIESRRDEGAIGKRKRVTWPRNSGSVRRRERNG